MAHITETRIGESTTTTGTGDVSLGGALTSHKTFSAVMSVGDTCFYDIAAVDSNGAETGDWEEGLGTYNSGNVLTRTTVLRSSNSDLAVSFSAGTKYVRLVAERRQVAAAPRGGSANQVLSKASGTDYDTQWATITVSGDIASSGFTMPTAKMLGRSTAGTGAIEEITVGSNLTLSAGTLSASGGSPGGASGTIQYNNSSAFGGMSGTSWDDTNRSLTITGATVTTSNPIFNLSQTWNAAGVTFTGLKLNVTSTASAAASLLQDWQVASSTVANLDKTGAMTANGGFATSKNGGGGLIFTVGGNNIGVTRNASTGALNLYGYAAVTSGDGAASMSVADTAITIQSVGVLKWTSTANVNTAVDAGLARKAAKVIEINSGTAGTYTGTAFSTGSQTVAQLPAAGTAGAGARSFVTDATATTFLSTVAGGGANKVPVVSDGTNWLIG